MNKEEKRNARCLCLEILYANSYSGNSFKDVLKNFFNQNNNILDYNLNEEQIKYASKLFEITVNNINNVDKMIIDKLVNWEIKRLALMDKIILRMSISEMLFLDEIPPKVSISEGVEIAKKYSTVDSSSFVNGILDAIYNEHYKDVKNKVSVHAIVSSEMNKDDASLMKEKLDRVLNKDTDLSIEVDSSLIGGIKLRIENTFLDASIKSQINNVKLDLMKI